MKIKRKNLLVIFGLIAFLLSFLLSMIIINVMKKNKIYILLKSSDIINLQQEENWFGVIWYNYSYRGEIDNNEIIIKINSSIVDLKYINKLNAFSSNACKKTLNNNDISSRKINKYCKSIYNNNNSVQSIYIGFTKGKYSYQLKMRGKKIDQEAIEKAESLSLEIYEALK